MIEAWVNCLATVLIGGAIMGLLVRGRAALCWAFFAYLSVVMTCFTLIACWPEHFWNLGFYSAKETGYFVLKVLIAVEIWRRTFATLARARVKVGFLLVGILLATSAMVLSTAADGRHPFDVVVTIIGPRQQAGSLALFALVATAAWWYRAPLHPLHRAILVGFSFYLPINTVAYSVFGWFLAPEAARPWAGALNAVAYNLTMIWWAWAAWRPVRAPEPIALRLQPWAHSW
jgi:hypothetical protein